MLIVERKGFTMTRTTWIWFAILCFLVLGQGLGLTMHIHYGAKKPPKV
jgi:hypothetical protein